MGYIIGDTCPGVKDLSCVAVCPVDCIIGGDDDVMLYINPDECIDCGACLPECPVNAIYVEDDTPDDQKEWIPLNADYFKMDRAPFMAQYGARIDAAKEKNRDSEYANPDLY